MNRYAIEVEYRMDGLDRRLSTGVPHRNLSTVVEVLQSVAATTRTNVEVIGLTTREIEPEALRFYRVQVWAEVDDQQLPNPYEVIVIADTVDYAQDLATDEVRDRIDNDEAFAGYRKVRTEAVSGSTVDITPDKARIVAVEEPA